MKNPINKYNAHLYAVAGAFLLMVAQGIFFPANASAACDLTLKVKKIGAKSAKLNGVSISTKQIEALKSVCDVKLEVMSVDELVNDFKKSLEKKLAKAQAASK